MRFAAVDTNTYNSDAHEQVLYHTIFFRSLQVRWGIIED